MYSKPKAAFLSRIRFYCIEVLFKWANPMYKYCFENTWQFPETWHKIRGILRLRWQVWSTTYRIIFDLEAVENSGVALNAGPVDEVPRCPHRLDHHRGLIFRRKRIIRRKTGRLVTWSNVDTGLRAFRNSHWLPWQVRRLRGQYSNRYLRASQRINVK